MSSGYAGAQPTKDAHHHAGPVNRPTFADIVAQGIVRPTIKPVEAFLDGQI